jgi:phage-related baseplate assembly protein
MSNFLPNAQLPDVLDTPGFDAALAQFHALVMAYLQQHDPERAGDIRAALQDDAGMIARVIQACCYVMNHKLQQANRSVLQTFATFARGDMLDAKVAELGLQRQILTPADPNTGAPAVLESDDALLTRYFLASYTLKPGSRLGYEFHARTVGERPIITIDNGERGDVLVRYRFPANRPPTLIRDARCVRSAPGEVTLYVLPHAGVADTDLLDTVSQYLHRDDIKEETDTVHVKAAQVVPYTIHVRVNNTLHQNQDFIREQLTAQFQQFADERRLLAAVIRPEHLGGVLYAANLPDYDVVTPANTIAGSVSHAPECTAITVEFI